MNVTLQIMFRVGLAKIKLEMEPLQLVVIIKKGCFVLLLSYLAVKLAAGSVFLLKY